MSTEAEDTGEGGGQKETVERGEIWTNERAEGGRKGREGRRREKEKRCGLGALKETTQRKEGAGNRKREKRGERKRGGEKTKEERGDGGRKRREEREERGREMEGRAWGRVV